MKGDSPEYERRDLKFKGTQIFFESTKMDLRREKVEPLKAQKFLMRPEARHKSALQKNKSALQKYKSASERRSKTLKRNLQGQLVNNVATGHAPSLHLHNS